MSERASLPTLDFPPPPARAGCSAPEPVFSPEPALQPEPAWGSFDLDSPSSSIPVPPPPPAASPPAASEPFDHEPSFALEPDPAYHVESEPVFELEESPASPRARQRLQRPVRAVPRRAARSVPAGGADVRATPGDALGPGGGGIRLVGGARAGTFGLDAAGGVRAPDLGRRTGAEEPHDGLERSGAPSRATPEPPPVPAPAVAGRADPASGRRRRSPPRRSRHGGGNGHLSDGDVDRIARRLVELLGDKTVRDVAWEVIPDMAEVVIKDRLRELESQVE